jgi:hypothetical protein
MQTFNIKVGDRLPVLAATLLDGDGAPVDLTTATGVTFRMRLQGSVSPLFNSACVITGATTGQVEYRWGASDTVTAGTYDGEFVVTWTGGKVQTVPNAGSLLVKISSSLA